MVGCPFSETTGHEALPFWSLFQILFTFSITSGPQIDWYRNLDWIFFFLFTFIYITTCLLDWVTLSSLTFPVAQDCLRSSLWTQGCWNTAFLSLSLRCKVCFSPFSLPIPTSEVRSTQKMICDCLQNLCDGSLAVPVGKSQGTAPWAQQGSLELCQICRCWSCARAAALQL